MSDIPKEPLYPLHGNSPSRHESLPSGMYSRPREFGAICEHKNLARSCESCDHADDLAELDRTKEMLEEAKKSEKAGWDRHAEKDRAYGAALKERDDARALAEQRAKEIAGLRGERDGLDSAGRTMGALLAESESKLELVKACLVVAVREKEELANVELALGMKLLDAETQLKQARDALANLANEVSGFLSMADSSVHGFTNMAVLKLRIDEARAALSPPEHKDGAKPLRVGKSHEEIEEIRVALEGGEK